MCVDNCTKNGMECDINRIMWLKIGTSVIKIGTSVIKIAQMREGLMPLNSAMKLGFLKGNGDRE